MVMCHVISVLEFFEIAMNCVVMNQNSKSTARLHNFVLSVKAFVINIFSIYFCEFKCFLFINLRRILPPSK